MNKSVGEMELEKYRRTIRSALGYRELKKKQEEIILRFISGNDVFGVLPTGFSI